MLRGKKDTLLTLVEVLCKPRYKYLSVRFMAQTFFRLMNKHWPAIHNDLASQLAYYAHCSQACLHDCNFSQYFHGRELPLDWCASLLMFCCHFIHCLEYSNYLFLGSPMLRSKTSPNYKKNNYKFTDTKVSQQKMMITGLQTFLSVLCRVSDTCCHYLISKKTRL